MADGGLIYTVTDASKHTSIYIYSLFFVLVLSWASLFLYMCTWAYPQHMVCDHTETEAGWKNNGFGC